MMQHIKRDDITSRRIQKLQKRIQRLQEQLHEQARLPHNTLWMCTIGSDITLKSINDGLSNFIGATDQQINKKSLKDFIHHSDYPALENAISQLHEREVFTKQYLRLLTKDGHFQSTIWHLHKVHLDENIYAIIKIEEGQSNDTARIKQLEAKNRELERELGKHKQHEAKLSHQSELLKRSNEELERFAHITAHDLREPLRNIASHVQILEKLYSNQLDEKAFEHLNFAVRGVKNLETVIKDLLMYSEIGSRHFNVVSIQTNDVVQEELRGFREIINQNQVHVQVGQLPLVKADESLLRILFGQLIDNAIRYNTSSEPVVSLKGIADDEHWQFSIEDNGPGISYDYQDRIFLLFQRLHGNDKSDGTGAGLAIAKKITELHQGTIWLDENMQDGTRVCFTIKKDLV